MAFKPQERKIKDKGINFILSTRYHQPEVSMRGVRYDDVWHDVPINKGAVTDHQIVGNTLEFRLDRNFTNNQANAVNVIGYDEIVDENGVPRLEGGPDIEVTDIVSFRDWFVCMVDGGGCSGGGDATPPVIEKCKFFKTAQTVGTTPLPAVTLDHTPIGPIQVFVGSQSLGLMSSDLYSLNGLNVDFLTPVQNSVGAATPINVEVHYEAECPAVASKKPANSKKILTILAVLLWSFLASFDANAQLIQNLERALPNDTARLIVPNKVTGVQEYHLISDIISSGVGNALQVGPDGNFYVPNTIEVERNNGIPMAAPADSEAPILYVNETNGDVYTYNGSAWVLVGGSVEVADNVTIIGDGNTVPFYVDTNLISTTYQTDTSYLSLVNQIDTTHQVLSNKNRAWGKNDTQQTNYDAVSVTDNIYQVGSVTIGNTDATHTINANLDVKNNFVSGLNNNTTISNSTNVAKLGGTNTSIVNSNNSVVIAPYETLPFPPNIPLNMPSLTNAAGSTLISSAGTTVLDSYVVGVASFGDAISNGSKIGLFGSSFGNISAGNGFIISSNQYTYNNNDAVTGINISGINISNSESSLVMRSGLSVVIDSLTESTIISPKKTNINNSSSIVLINDQAGFIDNANGGTIIGTNNIIYKDDNFSSVVLGGQLHTIDNNATGLQNSSSAIIAGDNNYLGGYNNSVAIGGSGLIIEQDNSVKVPILVLDGPSQYIPSTSTDPNGEVGQISYDNNFIYIKTTSGWRRTALDFAW